MFRRIALAAMLPLMLISQAQTTREEVYSDLNKSGGVYLAYPISTSENTAPPKGYKPFYISHYGRHGSRYLISDKDYTKPVETFHKAAEAGALTQLGIDVMLRLDSLMIEADGMGGALSPLGTRQHQGIAERMFKSFPEVFKGETEISARATTVPRCILSMDAFCERLKELNPKLKITRESANRYQRYLNNHYPKANEYNDKGPWLEEFYKFEQSHTNPDRLINSLFSDSIYVKKNVNPFDTMWQLYWIAVGMQDVETDIDFFDIFTPEELFDLWQCFNYGFYVKDANYAGNGGLPLANAVPLLQNILDSADAAIAKGGPSATLRFGHDGNLIPLVALMRFSGCYESIDEPERFFEVFSDFKISPMAGNMQMIFFRNDKNPDEILVKFMHNERETSIPVETDMFPFYKWSDVKKFYETLIKEYKAII